MLHSPDNGITSGSGITSVIWQIESVAPVRCFPNSKETYRICILDLQRPQASILAGIFARIPLTSHILQHPCASLLLSGCVAPPGRVEAGATTSDLSLAMYEKSKERHAPLAPASYSLRNCREKSRQAEWASVLRKKRRFTSRREFDTI